MRYYYRELQQKHIQHEVFKEVYIGNNLVLFHDIVCQFLVNYTGGDLVGQKITKSGIGVEGGQKVAFASDILFE